MAAEPNNSRLDRIEGIIEALATRQEALAARQEALVAGQADIEDDFRRLLIAQVVLTDRVDRLGERVDQIAAAELRTKEGLAWYEELFAKNEERFADQGRRIEALVSSIGALIARMPQLQ